MRMCTYWNKAGLAKSKTKKNKKIDSIGIGLASPEEIQRWGERRLPNGTLIGKVDKDHTVDYESLKPIEGGLFCERIFGPVEDFCCSCERRGEKNEKFCPNCEVEFTKSRVRRTRMGYIPLAVPVAHVWYLRGRPSYIANLIGKSRNAVDRLAYGETLCESFSGNTQNPFIALADPNLRLHTEGSTPQVGMQDPKGGLLPAYPYPNLRNAQQRRYGQECYLHTYLRSATFGMQTKVRISKPKVSEGKQSLPHTSRGMGRGKVCWKGMHRLTSCFLRSATYRRLGMQTKVTTPIPSYQHSAFDDPSSCKPDPFELAKQPHRGWRKNTLFTKINTFGDHGSKKKTSSSHIFSYLRDATFAMQTKEAWGTWKQNKEGLHTLPSDPKVCSKLQVNKSWVKHSKLLEGELRPLPSSNMARTRIAEKWIAPSLLSKNQITLRYLVTKLKSGPIYTIYEGLLKIRFIPALPSSIKEQVISKHILRGFLRSRPSVWLHTRLSTSTSGIPTDPSRIFFRKSKPYTLEVKHPNIPYFLRSVSPLAASTSGLRSNPTECHIPSLLRIPKVRYANEGKEDQKFHFWTKTPEKYNKFHTLPLFSTFVYKEWSHRFSFLEYFIWSAQKDDLTLPFYAHHHEITRNISYVTRKNSLNLVKNKFLLRFAKNTPNPAYSSSIPKVASSLGGIASTSSCIPNLWIADPNLLLAYPSVTEGQQSEGKVLLRTPQVGMQVASPTDALRTLPSASLGIPEVEAGKVYKQDFNSSKLAGSLQRNSFASPSEPEHTFQHIVSKKQPTLVLQNWICNREDSKASKLNFLPKTITTCTTEGGTGGNSGNGGTGGNGKGHKKESKPFGVAGILRLHTFGMRSKESSTPKVKGLWEKGDVPSSSEGLTTKLIDTQQFPRLAELLSFTGGTALRHLLSRFHLVLLGKFLRHELKNLELKVNNLLALKMLTYSQGLLLGKLAKRRSKQIRRLKLLELFQSQKSNPEWMILSVLPVLPPDLRPILRVNDDFVVASDLNRLYQTVLRRNNTIHERMDDPLPCPESGLFRQRSLQKAVDGLLENGKGGGAPLCASKRRPLVSLSHVLKGKKGLFRQHLLGKRVDYSGRSVIVVGPRLNLHECGLPKEMAMELFQPFLLHKLKIKGFALSNTAARRMIQQEDPVIWHILKQLVYEHPVLLNRAPTLHRLGIQGFQPRLVSGRAILLHPLVCSGFNADFDGDQMAVHVPLSFQARAEAWKIMWSKNNFLSPATGQPILVPSQDMVLGCYYLSVSVPRVLGFLTPAQHSVTDPLHTLPLTSIPTFGVRSSTLPLRGKDIPEVEAGSSPKAKSGAYEVEMPYLHTLRSATYLRIRRLGMQTKGSNPKVKMPTEAEQVSKRNSKFIDPLGENLTDSYLPSSSQFDSLYLHKNKGHYFSNLQDSLVAYFQGRLQTHTPFWVRVNQFVTNESIETSLLDTSIPKFCISSSSAGLALADPNLRYDMQYPQEGKKSMQYPRGGKKVEAASFELPKVRSTKKKARLPKVVKVVRACSAPFGLQSNTPLGVKRVLSADAIVGKELTLLQPQYGSSQEVCKTLFQDCSHKIIIEGNDTLEAPLELRLSADGNLVKILTTFQNHYNYNATIIDQCNEKSERFLKYMRTTAGRVVLNKALFLL